MCTRAYACVYVRYMHVSMYRYVHMHMHVYVHVDLHVYVECIHIYT